MLDSTTPISNWTELMKMGEEAALVVETVMPPVDVLVLLPLEVVDPPEPVELLEPLEPVEPPVLLPPDDEVSDWPGDKLMGIVLARAANVSTVRDLLAAGLY